MYLSSTSPTGIRFLASIKQGNGLKPSARAAGIGKETGYRWLRERYLEFRRDGTSPAEATAALGFVSSRLPAWEAAVSGATGRHHLQANVEDEAAFWATFEGGKSLDESALAGGVSRSTAYRWLHIRFDQLRSSKVTVKRCQALLRVTDQRRRSFERERLTRLAKERNTAAAAQHAAVLSSNRYADQALASTVSAAQQRRTERDTKYWQLMREGKSNAHACRLLGMHRRTGTLLRVELVEPPRPPTHPAATTCCPPCSAAARTRPGGLS